MTGSSSRISEQLDTAQAAWMRGDWARARQVATQALGEAIVTGEQHREAQACLLIAQVLALESHFGSAHQLASRARQLFGAQKDRRGIAEAALALSHVEAALGRTDKATARAQEAVAGSNGAECRPAAGLMYRGMAAAWNGDYGAARGILDTACQLIPEGHASDCAFQPVLNSVFVEVLKCADQRMKGHRTDLTPLESLTAEAGRLVKAGSTRALVKEPPLEGLFLFSFARCFLASRKAQIERADQHYLRCLERATLLPQSSWLQSLLLWARLERTMAAREVQEAAVSAQRLIALAQQGQHVPMKLLARRLGAEAQHYLGGAASPYATYM